VRATFQDVYTAPGLQVPWYVVAGNHDWVGNITGAWPSSYALPRVAAPLDSRAALHATPAELRLNGSAATGGRWFMPSTYYTFTRTAPGGDTVQFVMIDTETLTGGANPIPAVLPNLGYPAPVAPVRRRRGGRRLQQSSEADPGASSPLDPPVPPAWIPPPVNEAQWVWIQATLEASTADWIIVVGHHPVWSVGEYGPTWPLVERLAPMMESAGVALYICGHEHQMEHFRSEPHASGVDYLVVGNGAYYNDTVPTDSSHSADCPYGSLQFAYTEGTGFASLLLESGDAAAPSQLSATLYSGAGAQLYSFYKANPRTAVGHAVGNLGSPPAPPLLAAPVRSSADSLFASASLVAVLGGLLCMAGLARDHARGQPPAPRPLGPRDVVRNHMATWAQKQGRGETAPLVRPGDVALSYKNPAGAWADDPESPASRPPGALRSAQPSWQQRGL
jgi:hypothetical protein